MVQKRARDMMQPVSGDRAVYWAKRPIEELAPILMNRVEAYYQEIETDGTLALWRAAYCAYYGLDDDATTHSMSRVDIGGDGEVLNVRSAHVRNLVQHLLVLITADKIHFTPQATNNDTKTLQQVTAAKSILEHYEDKPEERTKYRSMALRALLFGEGYIWSDWDAHAGKVYAPDVDKWGKETGAVLHEGDIQTRALGPMEVIRDRTLEPAQRQWVIIRLNAVNKYDLAALYADQEELAKAIIDVESESDDGNEKLIQGQMGTGEKQGDRISMYIFYHPRSPALPDGRKSVVLTSDVWLSDDPLPLDDVPLASMLPDEWLETSHGYTSAWDLIAMGEMHDACLSVAVTGVDIGCTPNILAPEGCEFSDEDLSTGGRLLYYPPGMPPPQPLQLLDSRLLQAADGLRKWIRNDMETISGINAVQRGDVPSNIKSGTMAALIHAQALHFNSGLDAAFANAVRDHAMIQLKLFKAYATTERMIRMVGEQHEAAAVAMTGQDVADIERVTVDRGNPLMRALGGQWQMAETLLAKGAITSPKHFLEVVKTGRLDSVTYPHDAQMDAIRSENERLRKGEVQIQEIESPIRGAPPRPDGQPQMQPRKVVSDVPVLPVDIHQLHIEYHTGELVDPIRRGDRQIAEGLLVHIYDHVWNWRNGDPDILLATGQMPLGPPMMPPGGPPGPRPPGPQGTRPQTAKAPSGAIPGALGPAPPNTPASKGGVPVRMPQQPFRGQ